MHHGRWKRKPNQRLEDTCRIIVCYTDNTLNQIPHSNGADFQNYLWEVPVSVHAPDMPQVTALGNKSRVTGQEMCRRMYLQLPGVSFHSCEWVRRRWKPFSTPCLHSFLLKCPHKLTQWCCNMNLFPLSLPPGLSPVTLFAFLFLSRPVSHGSLFHSLFVLCD